MRLDEREKAVLEALQRLPTQHVVLVGGYAVNVYAPPRFSIDCDLVVLGGLPELEAALKKEGFTKAAAGDVPYGRYVRYEKKAAGVSFDLLLGPVLDRGSGVSFEARLFEEHSRVRAAVGRVSPVTIRLRVADPELLFAMKFVAGRRSDVRDLFMLAGEKLDWAAVEGILHDRGAPNFLQERASVVRRSVEAPQYRPSLQGAFGQMPDQRYDKCKGALLSFLDRLVMDREGAHAAGAAIAASRAERAKRRRKEPGLS